MARPPVGGASGASVGGFGEQTGSFDGMASGYATDDLTLYANQVAPFVVADVLAASASASRSRPQLRLQISTFAGYPGDAGRASRTPTSRAEPRFVAALPV